MITGAIQSQVDQVWNAFWLRRLPLVCAAQHDAGDMLTVVIEHVFPFLRN
jgi:hypothetical protein